MKRRRTSWTALAFLAWMGLFALFALAPSHLCETSVGVSLCVTSEPPLGLAFMPRQGPDHKILDAAFNATVALGALLAISGLIWLVRGAGKPTDKEKGRSDHRPF